MKILKSVNASDYLTYYLYTKLRLCAEYFIFTLPNFFALRKTKKLKDTKKGRNAFVFANGPSVNKLDPQKINDLQRHKGYDVFAGNSYINSDFASIVAPDYYIFSDPAHFGKIRDGMDIKRIKECTSDSQRIKDLDIPVFVPHRYYKYASYKKMYLFNDSFDIFSNHTKNIMKRRPYFSMTLYKALSIACYMGYDNIYICGFDNDFFKTITVDKNNTAFFENNYFYNADKNMDNKIHEPLFQSVSEVLLWMHLCFIGLKKFDREPIINLDESSLVDCFSKKHNLDVYK